jgi:Calx-beta domain
MGRARPVWRPWPHVLVAACLVGAAVAFGGLATPSSAAVDTPAVSFGPDMIVGEADGTIEIPVTLSEAGTGFVEVDYMTHGNGAHDGSTCNFDLAPAFRTLRFEPGDTSETATVQIRDCPDVEGFETFDVTLERIEGATFAGGAPRVGIVDNDTITETPKLVVRDTVVDEKDEVAHVSVLLGGMRGEASEGSVSVDYAATAGTATGGDYTATSGTLTFTPGQTAKTVVVPIVDDVLTEAAESVTLVLSNPSGGTIFDGTGNVTIGHSDATLVQSPRASIPGHQIVGEGDGLAEFVVSLASPSTETHAFDFKTTPLSANGDESASACEASDDFAGIHRRLTFAPGETTKVVPVEILDCPLSKRFKSFLTRLVDPASPSLPLDSARVGIVDNDIVVATPSLHVRDAIVDEQDGAALVSVLLGGAAAHASSSVVSVGYQTTNGTAGAADFAAVSGTLVFAPGETAKTVSSTTRRRRASSSSRLGSPAPAAQRSSTPRPASRSAPATLPPSSTRSFWRRRTRSSASGTASSTSS